MTEGAGGSESRRGRTARPLRGAGAREARRGLSPHPETKRGREDPTPAARSASGEGGGGGPGPAGGARRQPLHGRYTAVRRRPTAGATPSAVRGE